MRFIHLRQNLWHISSEEMDPDRCLSGLSHYNSGLPDFYSFTTIKCPQCYTKSLWGPAKMGWETVHWLASKSHTLITKFLRGCLLLFNPTSDILDITAELSFLMSQQLLLIWNKEVQTFPTSSCFLIFCLPKPPKFPTFGYMKVKILLFIPSPLHYYCG